MQICKGPCGREKYFSNFDLKSRKGVVPLRFDKWCKSCRRELQRTKYKNKKTQNSLSRSTITTHKQDQPKPVKKTNHLEKFEETLGTPHKKYQLPDGQVVTLTKSEFQKIVEWFIWLDHIAQTSEEKK